MNPLNDYPKIRKALYKVQWLLAGVTLVLGAYFVLAGYAVEDLPRWYVIGNGLLPVIWGYLGVQADTNTTPPSAK
jgi:hypothetical protein